MNQTPAGTVQFSVYLPLSLVSRIKHRAIDERRDLSAVVEEALADYLARPIAPVEEGS